MVYFSGCFYFCDHACVFWAVRLRQEEKRQQEESSKVKDRKRKREKYAEKVTLPVRCYEKTCIYVKFHILLYAIREI